MIFSSENQKIMGGNQSSFYFVDFEFPKKPAQHTIRKTIDFRQVIQKNRKFYQNRSEIILISSYFLAKEIIFEGFKAKPNPTETYFCVVKKLLIEWEDCSPKLYPEIGQSLAEAAGKLVCTKTREGSNIKKDHFILRRVLF